MPTRVTVGIGHTLTIFDGRQENMITKSGKVDKITQIPGTSNYRIHTDYPFLLNVEL